MPYKILGEQVFNQEIDVTSTTQNAPLGTKVKAIDLDTNLEAEYIYAAGVASTTAAAAVFVDAAAFTTALATGSGGGIPAIAMSANVASQYGWYKLTEALSGIYNLTAATLTVTSAYAGKTIAINRAAGTTVTLPAATGSGNVYKFFVGTTVTSNSAIIKVANASDTMVGGVLVLQDGGDTTVGFEAGSTDDTITLNGTTTGGIKGGEFEVVDIAANLFKVWGRQSATGTEATPFSATV